MPKIKSLIDDLIDTGKSVKAGAQGFASGSALFGASVSETAGKVANRVAGKKVFDGNADTLRSIAHDLAADADASRASVSERGKKAKVGSAFEGDLVKAGKSLVSGDLQGVKDNIKYGPDVSLRGLVGNAAEGAGSVAVPLAASLLTRGASARTQVTTGGLIGAAGGGGAAAQQEGDHVRGLDDASIAALPAYQQSITDGLTPEQAREATARTAESGALAATAPISALGGAATSTLFGNRAQALIASKLGAGRAGNAVATGVISPLEEGIQEVGEGVAQVFGSTKATGEQGRSLGEESVANFMGGVMASGPTSVIAGATSPSAVKPATTKIDPTRGVLSRAVAVGAAEGSIGGIDIDTSSLGAPPAGEIGQPPVVPQLAPEQIAQYAEQDAQPAIREAAMQADLGNPYQADFGQGPREIKPWAGLSPADRVVESRAAYQVLSDIEGAVAAYEALPGTKGGRLISTDEAREIFPDYNYGPEGRTKHALAVHEPSSFLSKEVWSRRLEEPVLKGKEPLVVFTAGGTGAGKTTAIKRDKGALALQDSADLTYDGNLQNTKGAVEKIDQAIASGRRVEILYVHREPVTAFTKGAIPRANKDSYGRTVPVEAHAGTHIGAAKTILELAGLYADNPNVTIQLLNNAEDQTTPVTEQIARVAGSDYNSLQEVLKNELEGLRQKPGALVPRVESYYFPPAVDGRGEEAVGRGEPAQRLGQGQQGDQQGDPLGGGSQLAQGAADERLIVNPVPAGASPQQKLAVIKQLTAENQPIVDRFLKGLDAQFGTESLSNVKSDKKILNKGSRPAILAAKPWFGVEHVRDTFRFKTVVNDVTDLPKVVGKIRELGAEIVKIDVDKLTAPKEWGFRFVALDLRLANGQLVEWYLPTKEIEDVKNATNHALFEKWRERSMPELTKQERAQYYRDMKASAESYEGAYRANLKRTGQDESAVIASAAKFAEVASSLTREKSAAISSAENSIRSDQDPSTRLAAQPSGLSTSTLVSPSVADTITGLAPVSTASTNSNSTTGTDKGRAFQQAVRAYSGNGDRLIDGYLDALSRVTSPDEIGRVNIAYSEVFAERDFGESLGAPATAVLRKSGPNEISTLDIKSDDGRKIGIAEAWSDDYAGRNTAWHLGSVVIEKPEDRGGGTGTNAIRSALNQLMTRDPGKRYVTAEALSKTSLRAMIRVMGKPLTIGDDIREMTLEQALDALPDESGFDETGELEGYKVFVAFNLPKSRKLADPRTRPVTSGAAIVSSPSKVATGSQPAVYQAPKQSGLMTFVAVYDPTKKSGRIDMIDVHPDAGGNGVGRQAVKNFEAWVADQGGTSVGGHAAFGSSPFWSKLGYEVSGRQTMLGGPAGVRGFKIKKRLTPDVRARVQGGFAITVAPKPGTKVQMRDATQTLTKKGKVKSGFTPRVDEDGNPVLEPYDRARDGDNLPPAAAAVQRPADLAALQEATANLFKRPALAATLKKLFGVSGLKMETIRGSYEGEPELSFHMTAKDLSPEQAPGLAQFIGMAFAQDAVIVNKPDPVGPDAESHATFDLKSTDGAKIPEAVFDAVAAELRSQGIDYSERPDGKSIRVIHFGEEDASLDALGVALGAAASAHGLDVDFIHTRSDLYEAQDYRRNLEEGGYPGGTGQRPEVFRALVDHLLVPYVRSISAIGYRFDAGRYADRFKLSKEDASYLKKALAPTGTRSTTGLLSGTEALPATKAGRTTNADAAWFLQNRAAALGTIDRKDRSAAALKVLSDTFADEIEYQIGKPEGKQAIGWYDRQLKTAIKTVSQIYPEIESDPKAGFVFKAILASSSQGLDVEMNFNVALKLYELYKRTGKVDANSITVPGKSQGQVIKNITKLTDLIDRLDIDGASKFIRDSHTIRKLKDAGFKNVGGRMEDTRKGWFVLGPKIGSFGNNLDGDYDTLTADLWFSRTWNRAMGTMFQYSAKREAEALKKFRTEVVQHINHGGNEVIDGLTEDEVSQLGQIDFDLDLAKRLSLAFAKGRYKDKTPLNSAAKALTENSVGLTDTPQGGPERRWQQEVMNETQRKIKERTGKQVSVADLQALLWYQEKELFRILGAANKSSAPLDYQDAAAKAVAKFNGEGLNAPANGAMVSTAYPLGREYLIKKVRNIVPDARVYPIGGTENATSKIAIDRNLTDGEKAKLAKIGGVKRVTAKASVPSGEVMSEASTMPVRYQAPAVIKTTRGYFELNEEHAAAVDKAMAGLKKDGYPKSWLQRPTFIYGHTEQHEFAGRFYLKGQLAGSVSFREDMLADPKEMRRIIAHEFAHASDFDADTGGMRTASSPRFAATLGKDGFLTYQGDVIKELFEAWVLDSEISDDLGYPFGVTNYQGNVGVMQVEAFAQAVTVYMTNNAGLLRSAPKTHAMIKEMFASENQVESGGVERGIGAIQRALQTTSSGTVSVRAAAPSPDQKNRSVDQGEQDRLGLDRSGRQSGGGRDAGVTNTPAFKKWFGKGNNLRDDKGNPVMVVYHGTDKGFDTFQRSKTGAMGSGIYTSPYKEVSKAYGKKIVPLYVRGKYLDNMEWTGYINKHGWSGAEAAARADGWSGVFDTKFEDAVLVWDAKDLKSFDRNSGEFSDDTDSYLGAPAPGVGPAATSFDGYTIPSWQMSNHLSNAANNRVAAYKGAAEGTGDKLRTMLQDYFHPVKKVQKAIESRGGAIDDETDVYGREELYYGRTGEQLRKIEDEHVKPLVKAMVDAGIKQDDLELYLYAKFAPARNARIASINPKFPDGGSGMTDADAATVLSDFATAGLTKKMEALAARVRALNEVRVKTLEDGQLLTPEEAKLWRAEPDYVPLKGFSEDIVDGESGTRPPTGQGFSIGGREAHRALGRKSRASDILGNIVAQTEQAIIRAEKNRVGIALLRLAEANPNDKLWTIDQASQKPQLSPKGEVSYRTDPRHQLADNVVSVKVNGEQHFVTLLDGRLAASMKNLGAAKMGAFLRAFSSINRFLSITRTMLAPEFVLANFARDIQTASVNLTGDQSAGMAARVVKDVPVALRAMYAQLRGKSTGGEWSRWAQEFSDEGGMTSFVAQRTVEEQQEKIKSLLSQAKGGKQEAVKGLVRETFRLIEDVNGAVENGTRLSAYANARRSGMSKEQAARLAKNLTVNFNRKGQAGPTINALYLFYNASIQGTTRFLQAMKHPRVQKIMGATAVIGFSLASMNRAVGGEDDDGEDRWDKIPDWEKARNMIIFIPGSDGQYVKIPLPYSYNLPFVIGAEIESITGGKGTASSGAANIANSIVNAFNPIGAVDFKADSAEWLAGLAAPTAVDPAIDIAMNRNFFGAPITPERNPFDKVNEPDSERAFASTSPAAKWLARTLNTATGGDALHSGLIDVSPASMVYVFDYLTGGTGGFVERAVTAASLAAKGEPVPTSKIPFYRVFAGEPSDRRVTDTFYKAREDVNLKAEMADLAKDGSFDSPQERREAASGRRLAGRLKGTERTLAGIRKRRKAAQADGDDAKVKQLQEKERAIQLRFNTAYFKEMERAEDGN